MNDNIRYNMRRNAAGLTKADLMVQNAALRDALSRDDLALQFVELNAQLGRKEVELVTKATELGVLRNAQNWNARDNGTIDAYRAFITRLCEKLGLTAVQSILTRIEDRSLMTLSQLLAEYNHNMKLVRVRSDAATPP